MADRLKIFTYHLLAYTGTAWVCLTWQLWEKSEQLMKWMGM